MDIKSQLGLSPAQAKSKSKKISAQAKNIKSKFAKVKQVSNSTSDISRQLSNMINSLSDDYSSLQNLASQTASEFSLSSIAPTQVTTSDITSTTSTAISDDSISNTNELYLNTILKNRIIETKNNIINNIVLLDTFNYTINSKNDSIKRILLEYSDKLNNQSDNKNFIVTKKRLAQFYDRNTNKNNIINNIMKLLFIIISLSFLVIFKDELITMLKGSKDNILPIYKKPELPTILSGIIFILYLSWFYVNKNIKEISIFMIATMIIYILFMQYLSTKDNLLNNNVLLGISVLPYIVYFIIEKVQFTHHIIPMYKKDFDFRSDIDSSINDIIKKNINYNFTKDYTLSSQINRLTKELISTNSAN